ncbi:unnamed protein product [Mytilus edulis]|uniref:SKICH domain-containing protein n=1 Tax=Mytilus edulis TaxID=6550 RepID=A0A8S3TLS5_MYTED|nr:unnamed protein product [Mytilus edulis]
MSDFDFELENINASSDLVTFRPVRDCYSNDYRIRLQWDIGDCFDPEELDYVGLFNTEWNSVDDFLAYKWAPLIPRHAYTLRRRSVQFTDADLDHVRMPGVDFVFLYVAKGDHVVGISNTFQFRGVAGYDEDFCFDTLEKSAGANSTTESRKRQTTVSLPPGLPLCSPSKRRVFKERILTVYKDHNTLASDFNPAQAWTENFNIVKQPVVKEYNDNEQAVVSYVPIVPLPKNDNKATYAQVAVAGKNKSSKKKLIYDIKTQNAKWITEELALIPYPPSPRCIEFPIRLPLLPGPQGLLEIITAGAGSCAFCSLSKVVISELAHREQMHETTIKSLKSDLGAVKVKEVIVKKKERRHYKPFQGSKEELFFKKKIGDLLRKNSGLLKQAKHWKNECLISQREAKNLKLTENIQIIHDDNTQGTQTTDHLIKEAVKALTEKETTDSGCNTISSDTNSDADKEENGWKIQKPKRMLRLQKVISQQSQTIQTVNRNVAVQRAVIDKQEKEIKELKKALSKQDKAKTTADRKLTEMTERVRSILRGRFKEKQGEWRQFARKINNGPIQEIRPMGATGAATQKQEAITKQPRPYFGINSDYLQGLPQRRPGKSERICPTCKMVFSSNVDPHVIEEHIVFHQVYSKKVHAD